MRAAPGASLDSWLKTRPDIWRGNEQHHESVRSLSTGFALLDNALPARGWGIACITELLLARQGIGEFSLLLPALRAVTGEGQWAALVGPPHIPYAPALVNAGIDPARLLVVDTERSADTLWAAEQVLRAGTFTVVLVWTEHSNARTQRRLQLAAEHGDTCAIVYRPAAARNEHSPVALRMVMSAEDSHVNLDIIKARGGQVKNIVLDTSEFDQSQGVDWPLGAAARENLSVRVATR